jgi:tetratricopeptide (TPR) repeat protein
MALPSTNDANADPSVDEAARKRFEAARREGRPEPLEQFLPPDDHRHYLGTLEELVHIELEFAWKAHGRNGDADAATVAAPPRVEDYLARFPRLAEPAIVRRLAEQEYLVRNRYGDRPEPDEYRRRFPEVITGEDLASTVPGRPAAPEETVALPGYEVLGLLGQGGMGMVYKARHKGLNRTVALKMIRAGAWATEEDVSRFRTEAEAVARLQHPNIVQVYDVGEHEGRPYLSLEYVDSGSLAARLRGTPLPPDEAGRLVETLAHAVHYAHERGIVHRDLKPANVLLAACGFAPDAKPQAAIIPKVTDFGLAKQVDQDAGHTRTGAVLGTPSYMAPEQAEGRTGEVGPRTDVYALGAILYELLTGRPPFRGTTVLETLDQVRTQEPVPPRRLQPRVPRDLETVCSKCLRKEAGQRYGSAAALADDLRRFREGEPIRARPAGRPERALKWARRRPALAALGALAAAALAGAVAFATWHAVDLRARLEQRTAEVNRLRDEAQEAREREALTALGAAVQELADQGEAALAREDWAGAQLAFAGALAKLGPAPAQSELRARAERLRQEAGRLQEARAHYRIFTQRRDDALFHETLLTGLDPSANREKTRAAAAEALALYGIDARAPTPATPPLDYLSAREKTEVAEGCYELLLVLAEVTAYPEPGQDAASQAGEALALLDRAARLTPPTRAYHLRRARYLAQRHDERGADEERTRAGQTEPAGALDHFLMGDEHCNQGHEDLPQAQRDFEAALGCQPDHFWAQYFLAVCCLRLPHPRPDLARGHLTACLGRRPDFLWVYLLRGFAEGELGDFAAAAADYREAGRRHPDDVARYALHANGGVLRLRKARALEAVADLGHLGPLLPPPADVVALAARAERERQLDEAAAEFRQAIALKPDQYQAYVDLAQVYRARRQWDEAVGQLDLAVRQRPGLATLYRERAQLRVRADDLEPALRDLGEALRLDPGGQTGPAAAGDHVERGRILYRLGRYEAAMQEGDAALTARPDSAAHRLRAEALLHLGRYQEAVRALDQYEKTGPPAAEVYRVRGHARAKLGDQAGAVEDYSRALALGPDSATFASRGWVYLLAHGAPGLALADFDEAIRHDPGNGDAYTGRGNARAQLGQLQAAAADADEALRRGPETPRLLLGVARIFALAAARLDTDQVGRRPASARRQYEDRATDVLRRALRLLPADQRAPFWELYVRQDTAWAALRRSPGFVELADLVSGQER